MHFCKRHRRGDSTAALTRCPQCKRDTNSMYKLCTGCAVRANRCAICLDPVEDITLGKRFKASVFAAEKKCDQTQERARRQLAAAIAPFAPQAAEFERAHSEALAAYTAGIKPYQDADQAAQQKAQQIGYNGGDIIAAADEAKKARESLWAAVKELQEKQKEQTASADAAFTPYLEQYRAAKVSCDQACRKAGGLMEVRFDQLFGHLRVDLHYREMSSRFR